MRGILKSMFLLFLLVFISIEIKPAPFDSGMLTFQQPDEHSFIGRIWGDEFIYWAETEDGYCFVLGEDGWYYYAQLDENGEYTPSEYKVIIDDPPIESYHLESSQSRIDEINQIIQEFKEGVEISREWYAQKQAEADAQNQPSVNLKIGIILIEFKDTTH